MRRIWMNGWIVSVFVLLAAAVVCTTEKTSAEDSNKPAATAQGSSAQQSPVLKTPMDKMSYSYGVETVRSFKKQHIEINTDAMYQGMKDAMAGDKFLMDKEELNQSYAMFQSMVRAGMVRSRMNAAQDNKKEGETFLAENKTKEGVVTLPSGLQYKVLKAGSGPKPKDSDVIECNYRGTLIDGTEFDSSARGDNEGAPATVTISSCIPGWSQALQLMPVGSKWQLFVPSSLAYGAKGTGRFIGPNATLIFEVELVAIK